MRVVQICDSKQLLAEEQGASQGEGMQRPVSVFDPVRINENGDKKEGDVGSIYRFSQGLR